MRRMLCAAVLAAAVSSLGFAQGASVTIQNEEGSTFYYSVDPQELAQVTPGSPLAATRVAEFFAAQADQPQFTALAPGAQASLTGLSDGAHLLVGFFAVDNQDAFPVRRLRSRRTAAWGTGSTPSTAAPPWCRQPEEWEGWPSLRALPHLSRRPRKTRLRRRRRRPRRPRRKPRSRRLQRLLLHRRRPQRLPQRCPPPRRPHQKRGP